MLRIGLTGSIACGKSFIARLFAAILLPVKWCYLRALPSKL